MPGATVVKPPHGARGFQTADGKVIPNLGHTVTPIRTDEGQQGQVRWKNAPVEMPILSTHEIALNNKELRYRADDGDIVDLETGRKTRFISLYRVSTFNRFGYPQVSPRGRVSILRVLEGRNLEPV